MPNSKESAARLARKASEAEGQIGIHGVSATAGEPRAAASSASRSAEARSFRRNAVDRVSQRATISLKSVMLD